MDLLATPGGLLSGSVQSSGHFLETACLFTCFAFMKLPSVFFLLLLPAKLFCSCCYSPSFISSSLMFLHIFIFTAAVMKLKQLFRCWNTECFYLLCWNIEYLFLLLVGYWRGVYWPSPFQWVSTDMPALCLRLAANGACTFASNC